jgi:cell division septation protein DedD
MRWFFLILLVVNVLYVTWELNRERPVASVAPALPSHVDRLVLLSELESTTAPQTSVAPATPEVAEAVPEAVPTVVDELEQQSDTGETVSAEVAVPGDADVAEDGTIAAASQAEAPSDKPTDHAVDEPASDLCYTLGPFREMKTLRVVTREIKDYVVEASFRSRDEQEQSMFRVYLKPVGGKREARALIKQLVSKNIRDYFIITDGPQKNGISLGYFSDKSRAQRHAERVRKSGFDAIVEPVFRSYTIYWLDYRIKAGNEIPQTIFDRHLNSSTTQRLSRSCT